MRYGVPYKGNKSKIVDKILACMPSADHFYDLFAGGCAVTHAALLEDRWGMIHANDIDGRGIRCFVAAVRGEYRNETRWISREDFEWLKDTDPYVAICWSFGNNMRDYLYSRQLEPYKKALHEVLFAETVHERRMKWRTLEREFVKIVASGGEQHSDRSLNSLQSLESLERLKSLERERLETTFIDYRDVPLRPNSVIYCDIPYAGRSKYGEDFDQLSFLDWAAAQDAPIFISSYAIDDARFEKVMAVARTSSYSATNNGKKEIEQLYTCKR